MTKAQVQEISRGLWIVRLKWNEALTVRLANGPTFETEFNACKWIKPLTQEMIEKLISP